MNKTHALVLAVVVGLSTSFAGRAWTAPPSAARPSSRPPVRRTVLANGMKLLSRQNDASEIVAIVGQVRAGLPDESEELAGLAAVTAEAALKGTTSHSDRGFQQLVTDAGGELRAAVNFDFTEFSFVTDRERWQKAVKLLADVIAHPSFEPQAVDQARETMKRRAAAVERDFSAGSYQALLGELYARGPYGRPSFGTAATLARITPEQVRGFWRDHYVQNRLTVAIVGDVESGAAITVAQKAFADVPFREGDQPEAIPTDSLAQPRVELLQKDGPAGQIMLGYLAPPVTVENYPVLSLLQSLVAGGRRSRLSVALRDRYGTGYALDASYQPLLGPSHMMAFLLFPATPADSTSPVIEAPKKLMLQAFRELAETGPTEAELARARAFSIGQHALQHEKNSDQARSLSWMEAAGLGYTVDQDFATRVGAVTKEQVQTAAKYIFKNYALVITLPPPD